MRNSTTTKYNIQSRLPAVKLLAHDPVGCKASRKAYQKSDNTRTHACSRKLIRKSIQNAGIQLMLTPLPLKATRELVTHWAVEGKSCFRNVYLWGTRWVGLFRAEPPLVSISFRGNKHPVHCKMSPPTSTFSVSCTQVLLFFSASIVDMVGTLQDY